MASQQPGNAKKPLKIQSVHRFKSSSGKKVTPMSSWVLKKL